MRKFFIALMCVFMATGTAMAQFTFGPKVGVDYTHYWGKDVEHGGQFNYQAGLFFEYRMSDKFAIAPEIVFAAQGGKYDYVLGVTFKETDHVNYINVPVMLKYYVTYDLSIDFGPQVGFNVYSKNTREVKSGSEKIKETTDAKDITKAVDFGLGLGLTYDITDDVFIQGRYTMGMTEVFKHSKAKNGNAQISIGYRF